MASAAAAAGVAATAAAAVNYNPAQQRFVYAGNGAAIAAPPVPYSGQLVISVSNL